MGLDQQQLRELFERSKRGPMPEMPRPTFDVELDTKGRVLGTGPERIYAVLVPILFPITMGLLTICCGIILKAFIFHSPLFRLMGSISALAILTIAQVITLIVWLVSGVKGPMAYIHAQFWFGSSTFQCVCSLVPIGLIVLVIALKTYKHIYLSKEALMVLVGVNVFVSLLCGVMIVQHLGGY